MRDPAELYAMLCRRRVAHGYHGMLTFYEDLTPPLLREESDALQDWLQWGGGPLGDFGMIAALQHHWFTAYQHDRAAKSVKWLHVTGGRALHGFVGDSQVPLCGVVPVRENGMPPHWVGQDRYSRRLRGRHADCVRAAREGGYPLWDQ